MNYDKQATFESRMVERFKIKIDRDWTQREARLHILKIIYDGRLYDNLLPWHMEYDDGGSGGKYNPLAQRRPSVIYSIPRIIIDESTSMLFGDSHFPTVRCVDDNDNAEQTNTDFLMFLVKKTNLKAKMLAAAKKGALGSVCIVVKVLKTKFFIDVLRTQNLMPVFKWDDPSKLEKLTEKRKVLGETLVSHGYVINEKDIHEKFFLVREWTDMEEIYYLPYICRKEEDEKFSPTRDKQRTSRHDLGFVPAVWIKNSEEDENVDGECTFQSVIDMNIEIDYQLSQLGRLLKYNSDPTLVIKNPGDLSDQEIVKGLGPLQLGENGDAYLLEMSTGSTTAVLEYVRCLRELALELVRGNRANPDKLSAINSGKALQMLNSKLITLVEDLRIAYGENGLKRVLCMMLEVIRSGKFEIELDGLSESFGDDPTEEIVLDWPDWYPPTPQDDLQEAQALKTYVEAGIMTKRSALTSIADKFHIINIEKELTESKEDAKLKLEEQVKSANNMSQKPKTAVARQPVKSVDRSTKRKT